MKTKVNLQMAYELLKRAELKLNQLYEDKDSGKINQMEFAIRAAECSGIFNGLASEASCLVQDCLSLPQAEGKDSMMSQLSKLIQSATKEAPAQATDIDMDPLRRRKIN